MNKIILKIFIKIVVIFGLLVERIKSRILFFRHLFKKSHFFIEKPINNKHVLLIALYEKDKVREDIFELIKHYKKNNFSIIAINTSKLKQKQKDKLTPFCDVYLERNNYGQCFGSYKEGLLYLYKHTDYQNIKSVTILNDSVYYLKENLPKLIDLSKSAHFFGLTENKDFHYHISSYALFISNKVLMEDVFKNFWKKYKLTSSRKDIILNGEIKLSKILIENNYNLKPAFDIDVLSKIYLHQIFELYPRVFLNNEDYQKNYQKIYKALEGQSIFKKIKYLNFFSYKHHKQFEANYLEINTLVINSFMEGSQIHKNYLIFLYDQFPCIKLDLLTRANISIDDLSILNKMFQKNQDFISFQKLLLPKFIKKSTSLYKETLYRNGII